MAAICVVGANAQSTAPMTPAPSRSEQAAPVQTAPLLTAPALATPGVHAELQAPSATPAVVAPPTAKPAAPVSPLDLTKILHVFDTLSAPGWQPTETSRVELRAGGALFWKERLLSESTLNDVPLPLVTNVFEQRDALREFGCTHVFVRQFQRGMRNVNLFAYRFANAQGAYGAYTNMREGATNFVVRGDRSSEDDEAISFQRGNYFVLVKTTAQDDDEAKEMLTKLADTVVAQIPSNASLPAVMSKLPGLDRVGGSERLFMGGLTARRHTSIPYIGQLNLEESLGSACADYTFAAPLSERMKLLIVEFSDPQIAQDTFNRYVETLGDVHRVVTSSGNSALFKISDNFLYAQTQGKDMVVIAGARKRISPLMLVRQLGAL